MIRQLSSKFLGFALILSFMWTTGYAQLPYGESFTKSTAAGIIFGGTPIPAFLTAGAPPVPGQNGVPTTLANGNPNDFTPPARDAEGAGFLRLTNSNFNQKGYIFSDASFPAQKGLHIEVEYFVYEGTGGVYGADGTCFFLFDGSVTNSDFHIGGFGGSLGYAPKLESSGATPVPVNGVSKGYIGVGLDEYGNFSNNTEGRSGGDNGAILKPGSVTIRGKGDGAPFTTEYPFLSSVQTSTAFGFNLVPNSNGNATRITDSLNTNYRRATVLMEPIGSNPVTGFKITVYLKVGGVPGTTYLVVDHQVYNTPPPALLKYGISASTGDATNNHEIRNVTITVLHPSALSLPVANPDVVTACVRSNVAINPLTNDTTPNEGGTLAPQLLDLDPSTAGRQNSFLVAGKGTFTADNAGNVVFQPLNNTVTGPISVNYSITDNYTQTSLPGTITINDPPAPTINAGANQSFDRAFSASPNFSATLTATVSAGVSGSWSLVSGPTTTVTFGSASSTTTTANGLTYGLYTFRYTGATTLSCPTSSDVTVFVNAIPVTNDDNVTTSTGTLIHIPVLNNDTDANGDATINKSSVTIVTPPVNGTYTIDPSTGVIDYRPNAGFQNNSDSFSYNVKDDHNAQSNNSIVTIAVSIKPVGVDDLMATVSNVPLAYNIVTNDGAQAAGTTAVKKTDPVHGTLTNFTSQGAVTYAPAANYHGTDIFTYALKNIFNLESNIITVNITVRPTGVDDIASTGTNTSVNIPVKTNDPGQTGSTVIKKTDPAHGTILILGDGTVQYTPAADYQGTDLFTYALRDGDALESDPITVSVTVKPAGTDDAVSTNLNTAVIISVKDNDASKTGTTVIKKTDPGHGTAIVNNDGTVTYTPTTSFQGTDVFTYALRNSGNVESDPITVTIVVKPKLNTLPDAVTTNINTGIVIPVKTNDPDGSGATVIKQTNPTHGTATVNPDGTVTYTPATDYYGSDTFNYILQSLTSVESDATVVTINVRPAGTNDTYVSTLNTPIVASVKDNDVSKIGTTVVKQSDPLHGTATVNGDNTITYAPATDYYGQDTFTYLLRLAGIADSAPILVTVNIRPSGTNDTYTIPMNTTAISAVKNNDVSKIGTTVVKQTEPIHGTATVNGDNSITYTPVSNYSGIDNFTYVLRTADPLSSDAITVRYNIKPVGLDDAVSVLLNTAVVVSEKDNDPSKLGTTVLKKTDPIHGTAVLNTDGTFSYTPTTGYTGTDIFTYSLLTTDGVESDPVTVNITINPKLIGVADNSLTNFNTAVNIPVKDNDPGSTSYTVVKQSDPIHGSILVNTNGSITYVPTADYYGPDSFNYLLTGTGGLVSDPILVTIGVRPSGSNDAYVTPQNTPITAASVKDNDVSKSGTTVVKQSEPAHGTATVNSDGVTVNYIPTTGYYGQDTFNYLLRLAGGLDSNPILVTIGIRPAGSADVYTTPLNTAITASVKDNDASKIGTNIIKQSDPLHGIAVVNADNTITYTPTTNYSGIDNMTYVLATADPVLSDVISVRFNVKPVGTNDAAATPVNTSAIVPVKDNDASKTGTTVLKKTDPIHGTAVLNVDGTITYTPVTNYLGSDIFTYSLLTADGIESDPITVAISVSARLPTLPDFASTDINTAINIPVKENDPSSSGLTVIKQSNPSHGTAIVNADGTVAYTPVTDYYGPDTFNYILQGTGGQVSDPTLVTISVRPAGINDTYSILMNTSVVASVKDNDISKVGTNVIKQSDPLHGIATVNADNTVTYVPTTGYYGTDSFIYTLRILGTDSNPIVVAISIRPVGTNDTYTTSLNTAVNATVKDNDASKIGTTVVKQAEPLHGTAVVNTDNSITYTPAANYSGIDNLTYILRTADPLSSDVITVRFSVKPAGTNDAVAVTMNTSPVISVKDNDISKTGTTVLKKSDPAHGTAVVNTDGTVTYSPVTGYLGADVFTYSLLTADGIESDPITVNITVGNKLPTLADVAVTDINTAVSIPVKDNDPSSTSLTVVKQSDPSHGTVLVNANGTVTYTPAADYYGPDSFNYILQGTAGQVSDPTLVSITVRPAGVSDTYSTSIGTSIVASVKDNDISKVGTSVVKQSEPLHGTATVNVDNTITYVPAAGYYGPDTFLYTLRILGIDSNPILVTINIRPAGTNDSYTTALNTAFNATVKDNDLSKTGTTVVKVTDPAHGTAVVNADNSITYTPATNYSGIDNMSYLLRTADPLSSDVITVRFNIKPAGTNDAVSIPLNTSPIISVKDNDVSKTGTTVVKKTDPLHGTAVLNPDGTITYSPLSGYQGTDLFTYTLLTSDGIESDPITVNILVSPKLPALPDVALTTINTGVTISVKDNDPNSTLLTVTKQSNPLHGTATVNSNGTITYVPATDYYGPDSFNYILQGTGGFDSDPTLVTIGVRPAGTNDTYTAIINTPLTSSVKDNDVSKTGTTVVKQTDPLHGTAVVNADNTITYTPAANYSGTDNLTYILRTVDPLLSDVITVKYNVKPGGTDDIVTTTMGVPVVISEKDNDVSKTGTTVTKKTEPLHGTATVNADGTITYVPVTGYHGKDTFTYTLKTSEGIESDPITITLNVKPAGVDDTVTAGSGTPLIIMEKDNDPGKTGTTVAKKTDPLHGSIVVNADGTITYISTPGYKGPDTFTYTLKNGDGLESDPITVTLDVRNLPVATPDVIPVIIGQPVVVNVTSNDTGDGPIDKTTVTITTQPLHGTISVNSVTGEITYTPTPGYSGPDAFAYTVKDNKGLESKPAIVAITVTSPKIGLAKKLVEIKSALNGSYDLKYLFTIVNYSPYPLKNLSLKDDLLSVFSGTDVTVLKVSHQGALILNKNFNGNSDIELLTPSLSTIAANGEEQIELTINVKLVSRAGVFQNSAIVEGTNSNGLKTTDQSTDGLKPDPTTTGDPSPSSPTLADLKLNPIFIPQGFSPNGDGINDYFVIQNTLDKPVMLEMYNRWNNLVYKSTAYQNDWDGRTTVGLHIGDYVPAGTYWYRIKIDGVDYHGFITINR